MPRPRKRRIIKGCPPVHMFKPAGIPAKDLEVLILSHEEYEAIRLADFVGMSQEDGAREMGVSRATFGRILHSAHRVVAEALVKGNALSIEGGDYMSADMHSPDGYMIGKCAMKRHRHGKFRGGR